MQFWSVVYNSTFISGSYKKKNPQQNKKASNPQIRILKSLWFDAYMTKSLYDKYFFLFYF